MVGLAGILPACKNRDKPRARTFGFVEFLDDCLSPQSFRQDNIFGKHINLSRPCRFEQSEETVSVKERDSQAPPADAVEPVPGSWLNWCLVPQAAPVVIVVQPLFGVEKSFL